MVRASGYGVSGTAKIGEIILFFLFLIGVIVAVLWYVKSQTVDKVSDAISKGAKDTYHQVTDPKNTLKAITSPTYQGAITTKYCPTNPQILAGDRRCAATQGYETEGSVNTRMAALPGWEQDLVNAGNFITGGLASQAGAYIAGKSLYPNAKFGVGDIIIYNGKQWTISGITPTNYLLDDGSGGSFNPLISDVDIEGIK